MTETLYLLSVIADHWSAAIKFQPLIRQLRAVSGERPWQTLLPFWISLATTAVYLAGFLFSLLRFTHGRFVYPLDDPFIHLQIARNLVEHGSWGINPGVFSAASSSLLYPPLLAFFFKVFGMSPVIPFAVNALAATILLFQLNRWLSRHHLPAGRRTAVLLLLVFLMPVPVIVLIGMEHTLQTLFGFLFLVAFTDYVTAAPSSRSGKPRASLARLLILSVLVTGIRFEGMFLIGLGSLFLLFYRRFVPAFLLVVIGMAPIVIFGSYSMAKGGFFLPNSVMMKSQLATGGLPGLFSYAKDIILYKLSTVSPDTVPFEQESYYCTLRLLILLPVAYFFFPAKSSVLRGTGIFLLLLSGCVLAQLSFANTGWFFRYEAYLLVPGLGILFLLMALYGPAFLKEITPVGKGLLAMLLFAGFLPFFVRGGMAFAHIRRACMNIYEQQYQSAAFIRQYYDHSTIAVNDIGVVSNLTDARMIDLYGLANIDVARARKGNYASSGFLDSLVRKEGVTVAIVYKTYFPEDLLNRWTVVASMEMPENIVCGSAVVYFYVPDAKNKAALAGNLHAFAGSVPEDVKFTFY